MRFFIGNNTLFDCERLINQTGGLQKGNKTIYCPKLNGTNCEPIYRQNSVKRLRTIRILENITEGYDVWTHYGGDLFDTTPTNHYGLTGEE